jgi:predicted permease
MTTPRWRRYLRLLRPNVEGDVAEELDFHLAMREERNRALGMSPDEARRSAERRFGDLSRYRDALVEYDTRKLRERGRQEYMSDFLQDIRFGWRSLRAAPGFAIAAVLTLALGIGANAAIFSVVDAVVLNPLPYRNPRELVALGQGSAGELVALRERLRSFLQVAAYVTQTHPIQIGEEEAQRIEGAAITPNLLAMLGVAPAVGRPFTEEDARYGTHTSLLLSDAFWKRSFGGSRAVIGSRVLVEGVPFTVVGVMPADFAFPSRSVHYWQPYAMFPQNVGMHWAVGGKQFIARMAPGVTLSQAHGELREVWPTMRLLNPLWDPGENYGRNAAVTPLHDTIVGSTGSLLWVLFGCVLFVLLIGCINVANLLLARATARERELAVRAALGGGRGRLVRQLVTESLLLSAIGATLGVGVAYAGVSALVSVMPAGVPRAEEIGVSGTVLAFTAIVAVVTGLLFGVIPALRATHFSARDSGIGVRATSGVSHQRVSGFLVAGEVAIAVLVVIASTLLVRSFTALQNVDPGFDTERVIAARVSPPAGTFREFSRTSGMYAQIFERVRALPGVQQVGAVDRLPLAQRVWGLGARIRGQFEDASRLLPSIAHLQTVTPGYFETMGIPVRGRPFTESDRDGQPPVAIVSQSVARTYWPNGDAIGQQVGYPQSELPWLTIVGVVPDTKQDSLRDTAMTSLYVPWLQRTPMSGNEMWVLARTSGDPTALAASIRRIVSEVDRSVAVSDVRTMDAVVSASVSKARFTMMVVGLFAMAAVLLGAVGIYGVMSYVVGQRRQEMGVRLALGATPGRVVSLIVGRAVRLAAAGAAVGLAAAAFATGALGSLLYGIGARDPVTFALVPAVFLVVAVLASCAPAMRATKIDPARTLRAD